MTIERQKMSDADKKAIRKDAWQILERKGVPKTCAYCGIKEQDFIPVWGKFYAGNRWSKLEPDHKDNDLKNSDIDNLCWAYCLCNRAKSDKLTYEEMKEVGNVIGRIWEKRAASRSEKATPGIELGFCTDYKAGFR